MISMLILNILPDQISGHFVSHFPENVKPCEYPGRGSLLQKSFLLFYPFAGHGDEEDRNNVDFLHLSRPFDNFL